VRVLLALTHLRTNPTTRALAALFTTSQSTVDRIIHHLVPLSHPDDSNARRAWIIDGTLIPVHDQTITAISKNYRRSLNTQIIICADRRRVVASDAAGPVTATMSWSPVAPLHTRSTAPGRSGAMVDTTASTPSPHHSVTAPAGLQIIAGL
jgi:hypothetical protein